MNREISIKNPYAGFIEKLLHSNKWQYWSLQTVGWSGYTFFVLSSAFLLDKADIVHVIYIMFATTLGFLLSVVMHKSFKLIWDAPPVKQLLLSLLTVGLTTGLWSSWKFYVATNLYHELESGKMLTEYIYWYSYSFFIILSWAGLYYGIKYYKVAQQEKEKTLQASAMAHQAQLKMLRYQLNPHFLFNTLNSISTLILENQSRPANSMITKLSSFLRYSLDNDPMQRVSLSQEIEVMKLYLDIEKERFGDRLTLNFDIDEKSKQALVPSMLLQPMIENSIKYAIASSITGGTINITAKVLADELIIVLSDDGPGIELNNKEQKRSGVGLANIKDRLQTLYENRHSWQMSNMQPHGLKIKICIPFSPDNVADDMADKVEDNVADGESALCPN